MSAVTHPVPRSPSLRAWGILAALTFGRIVFGYQLQTVASLGPDLVAAFHLDFVVLGSLFGAFMLPGVAVAIPFGLVARRLGERPVAIGGLLLMTLGSLVSAASLGPGGMAVGRMIAGGGAVAMTVLQGKVVADRFEGAYFTMAIGVIVGAFPIGIGIAQLIQEPIASAYGWPAAFVSGGIGALATLGLFLACWETIPGTAASRRFAWPSRHECLLVIVAGLIWTAYTAGYSNFLAYTPTLMAARGHPKWVADLVMVVATWGNLPAILLGGGLALRLGVGRVFVAGTVLCVLAVGGMGVVDVPILWGLLFGTMAAMHGGIIVELGNLSCRPENRAVGMGLFYTTYYIGGAGIPALCGKAADLVGDLSGAFYCSAAIAALALPFYWLHRRWRRAY